MGRQFFDPEKRVGQIIQERGAARRKARTTEGLTMTDHMIRRVADALEGIEGESREQSKMLHRIQRALEHLTGNDDLVVARMGKILKDARKSFLASRCFHVPSCDGAPERQKAHGV